MKKKYPLLVLLLLLVSSCDCFRQISGVVLDSKTRQPVKVVKIEINNQPNMVVYTDTLGRFEFISKSVGLPFCLPTTVSFEKNNYQLKVKKYKYWTSKDTVLLEQDFK